MTELKDMQIHSSFRDPAGFLFRRDGDTRIDILADAVEAPLLVAWGAHAGRTSDQVAAVRERRPDMIGLSGLLVKSAHQMVDAAKDAAK